jgi:two-component system cell cycle response regulator DivK
MKTILQIEDNNANKTLVERVLEPQGYRMFHAPDGGQGLKLAEQEHPNLILLDLGLPDIDGQTLVGMLRDIPGLEDVPIVALTAWPEHTAMEMVRRYGCTGCITKPIDVARLAQQVDEYLKD